ncbi:hypothetical protein QLX08_000982 [Tetragonisca angustula]|uniref:Ribosomal protein S4 n=1 Tax=Tetragonisca angustula TaxID=166442 RepID=A0AAW1AH04_9HYME
MKFRTLLKMRLRNDNYCPARVQSREKNDFVRQNRSSIRRTIEERIGEEKINLQSVRFQLPQAYSVQRSKSMLANISWFR